MARIISSLIWFPSLEDKVLPDKGEIHQQWSSLGSKVKVPTVLCSCSFSSLQPLSAGVPLPHSLGHLIQAHGFRYWHQQYADTSQICISNTKLLPWIPDWCIQLPIPCLTWILGITNSTYHKLSSWSSYQNCFAHILPSLPSSQSMSPVSTVATQVQVPSFCGCVYGNRLLIGCTASALPTFSLFPHSSQRDRINMDVKLWYYSI